jgi:manganese/iron transport system ATP-binding protein/manganese/zinc/iron transport system ATP- binding protein
MPARENGLSDGSAIAAQAVAVAYEGGAPVFENLDLQLPAGELVIVLGPNGGGKTTLFKALVGELRVTAGTLDVNAAIAYLPQYDASRTDFPVSALDVTMMGSLPERRIWQRPGRADRKRARAALERVGLGDRANDTYGELSGGQRRRVLLARTIVRDAGVIVLDEPLAGVDPASAESIRATLVSLRDEGRLVLVASHDVDHARRADRVLCLNKRLIANGDPASVLTDDVLRETYAADLTIVTDADGIPIFAAAEHHHHH